MIDVQFEVQEDGIYKLTSEDMPPAYSEVTGEPINVAKLLGIYRKELVMSKETFIEAFDKYVRWGEE